VFRFSENPGDGLGEVEKHRLARAFGRFGRST